MSVTLELNNDLLVSLIVSISGLCFKCKERQAHKYCGTPYN